MQTLIVKILFAVILLLPHQYKIVKKIEIDTGHISADSFGRLYIYSGNMLQKYDKTGKLLSVFSNQMYGRATAVDVSDPYILLLFYAELNQIVFLDDKLSPIGSPLNLDELGMFNISTVCKSKQFAVWVYDRFDNRLIQYGFNPKEILQEINLDLLNIVEDVVFMRESGNYLVLNTTEQLIVFDQFGSYIKSIDSETPKYFQLQNEQLVWFKNNHLVTKLIKTGATDSLPVNFITDIENVLIENDHLYIQKKDTVFICREER